ncbi:hypothetical protein ACOMHN_043908 [Nucella lapillus]
MFRPSFPKKVNPRNPSLTHKGHSHHYSREEVKKRSHGLIVLGTGLISSNQSNCSVHSSNNPRPIQPRDSLREGAAGHLVLSYPGSTITGSVCCRRRRDRRDVEEDVPSVIRYVHTVQSLVFARVLESKEAFPDRTGEP